MCWKSGTSINIMYSNNVRSRGDIPLLSEAKLLVGHGHQRQETGEICFQLEKTHDEDHVML